MDIGQEDLPVHMSPILHSRSGPLCIPFKPRSTEVCLEVPRSGGSACGCIPSGLEQMDLSNPSPVVFLPRVLRKIKEDQATAVFLIAPNWTGQPWFSDLIQMLVDRPLLLPQGHSLLFLPFQPTAFHPLWKSLQLAVWPLSGTVNKQQAFERKLLTSCWPRGDQPPRSGAQAPGRHG